MAKEIKAPSMNTIPDKMIVKDEYAMEQKSGKREIDPRPEFCISADVFPAMKDWSVGKKYMLEVEAEMVGSKICDYGEHKGKLIGTFRISGIMSDDEEDASEEEMKKGGKIKEEKVSAFPKGMTKEKK